MPNWEKEPSVKYTKVGGNPKTNWLLSKSFRLNKITNAKSMS